MKSEIFVYGFMSLMLVLIFVSTMDDNVVFIGSSLDERGNLEVAIQDQFTEIIDLKLSKNIAVINITNNTSIGDRYVNISSGVAPQVDDLVCFKEGTAFYQGEILSVTPIAGSVYEIFLDKPLDYAFTTEGGCSIREDNWAVDGSVTPQTFSVSPANLNSGEAWDIIRMIMICRGDGVGASNDKPDTSSFFTQVAITNGIYFRHVDGTTKNIFNAKDNFHLTGETFDLTIYDANRQGEYAVVSRRTFNGMDKNGVTIRLNADTNDTYEQVIQDDLTDMSECHTYIQGHRVSN